MDSRIGFVESLVFYFLAFLFWQTLGYSVWSLILIFLGAIVLDIVILAYQDNKKSKK